MAWSERDGRAVGAAGLGNVLRGVVLESVVEGCVDGFFWSGWRYIGS